MSSEISSIEAWTGRAFSARYVAKPKASPNRQITRPIANRVQPDIVPKKVTEVKSGRWMLASPPP